MRTLHTYFGREMLKSFGLAVTALTLLIVMGGGIAQIFLSQGIGAGELGRVFLFLVPIAILLMTPIAMLFAATITFGRAAADNEILACQAAGINMHRTLLPAAVFGVLVGIVAYLGWNFFIPSLLWSVEDITRRDLPKIVSSRLTRGKPLAYGNRFVISSDACHQLNPTQLEQLLPPELREGNTYLQLVGVSFMEKDADELLRIGTADETIIRFDNTGHTPKITVDLQIGRSYDAQRRQYLEFEHQVIGPIDVPMPIQRRIRFENLPTLRRFQENPLEIPELQDLMHGMRRVLKEFFLVELFKDDLLPQRGGDGRIELTGRGVTIRLDVGGFRVDPANGRIQLQNVDAVVTDPADGLERRYQASLATVALHDGLEPNKPLIQIELKDDVRYTVSGDDRNVVRKPKETLPGVGFHEQPQMHRAFTQFDESQLLQTPLEMPLFADQVKKHQALVKKYGEYRAEILGEIHFRMSMSVAVVVWVITGAMLAIYLRGGQVLIAFGISCIPVSFWLVASLVARSFDDKPHLSAVVVSILWGATAIQYFCAWFIGFRMLRR